MDNPDPELRLNPELLNQTSYRVVETQLYGANAEWNVSDRLTIIGDVYRSTSKRHSGGQDSYVVLRMNQPNTAHIELTGERVPSVTVNLDDERSQLRNRAIAEERLVARLSQALHVEVPRRKTKPSKGAKERRLQGKKQRSQTKANRQKPRHDS